MPLPEFLHSNTAKHGELISVKSDIYIGRSVSVYGQWCESEVRLFNQILRPGDIAVDAGANIGALSVPMAKAVGPQGRVYCFEPQPVLAGVLSSNLLNNGFGNGRVMSLGLADKKRTISIPDYRYEVKQNFGGKGFDVRQANASGFGAITLAAMPLDDVIQPKRLRLIKADVEGMELALVRGAEQLIRKFHPILYLENDRPEESDALIHFLEELGYQCFWHVSRLFDPNNWAGVKNNIFGAAYCVNLLCVFKGNVSDDFVPAIGKNNHPRAMRKTKS